LLNNQAAEHLRSEDFLWIRTGAFTAAWVDLQEVVAADRHDHALDELDRNKDLQAIGDVAYVSSLWMASDRPSIEHYVKIVRDKALMRGLISAANTAIARAADQIRRCRRCSERCGSGDFAAFGEAHWPRIHGHQEIVRESLVRSTLCATRQRITGLATHYTDLDEMTSGLQRSDLVIIGRGLRWQDGFRHEHAENAAIEDQQVVGVFSLEMSREALLMRLLCSQARVDAHKMRTGSLWQDDTRKLCGLWSNSRTRQFYRTTLPEFLYENGLSTAAKTSAGQT